MRKIRFRAWDDIKKEWLMSEHMPIISEDVTWYLELTNYHDCNWLQYTGLKDKQGKEIYEGDIVIGNYLNGNGVITWNDKSCRFQIDQRATISPCDEFEVIGNIYEDAELLEQ